ncbi:MAG TPA: DNA polymerase III subunit delta [Pyrinomonadaceae bacterium]|nr:DNA polymerase III subunit delta [Chloracidobacterium sp.]MBP9934332.1 DNA polymerase III subunit delta [Pyrinomonadaceae bacterium]MBK7801473.1 DNA polymerase III subunit delta [Chloracidobacterium sp.]MBK9436791.1 DNA polymerase III subunit delta [Chloracidobacterium sp.]MBK9766436.1 DNA polymerase III subunit delta [Chloracidobacterium sp.]
MAVIKREDLRAQLRRREMAPVYVLFGPETYLRDLAARTIADFTFADGDLRDFNETEYSLNVDGNLERAIAAANQLPMMAAKRIVRVIDVRVTASGHRDTLREEHETLLTNYFRDPSPSTIMIFVADDLNGVRKIGKLLRAEATAVDFEPMDDGELTNWAREKFKATGTEIDEQALRHLIALVGNDASRVENEAAKLSTAALPERRVTMELIDPLVPNSRELTNFELTDNLVSKNRKRALAVLKKILDDGAEPLMILGLISYNYRRLVMAKDLMLRGADRGEVARVLRLRYSDQENFLAAARRAEMDQLTRVLARLAETDLAIKTSIGGSGPQGARIQIEVLVCELASM